MSEKIEKLKLAIERQRVQENAIKEKQERLAAQMQNLQLNIAANEAKLSALQSQGSN